MGTVLRIGKKKPPLFQFTLCSKEKKPDNLEYQIDIHLPAFNSKVSEDITLSVPLRPNKKGLPLAVSAHSLG